MMLTQQDRRSAADAYATIGLHLDLDAARSQLWALSCGCVLEFDRPQPIRDTHRCDRHGTRYVLGAVVGATDPKETPC